MDERSGFVNSAPEQMSGRDGDAADATPIFRQVSNRIGIALKLGAEEDEVVDWHEGDQMEEQWDKDEQMEEILGRRRVDGGSLQAGTMQKVPELVAHERMSEDKKGERVRRKEKSERMVHWRGEEQT